MTQISEGERIVKLMLFVRECGPVSLAAIRRQFPLEYGDEAGSPESTRRRFERDKKTLQDNGIFIVVDEQQRYSLDAQKSFAAPLVLTEAQASLLRLLCNALLEDPGYPFKEDLRMVLVKLGDELELPDMLPQAHSKTGLLNRLGEPQGFSKIRKAISIRKRLGFSYANSNRIQSMREVEPFGCFFLKGTCYVVAFDPDVGEERCFRLDRMSKIRVNAKGPGTPDFEERPFDASKYYGLPFQFGGEPVTARLRFDERVAERARRISMRQGYLEQDGDGLIWTVECRDMQALVRWCIENGPGIRILEPHDASRLYEDALRSFLDASGYAHGKVAS